MGNLFDYLDWRGDLSFGNAPLSPVDTLVFSALSYLHLEEAIPASPREEPVRLTDATPTLLERIPKNHLQNHTALLRRMAASTRYASLRLLAAQKELDAASGIQFSAFTVLLPGQNMFVCFEGTDDTLIGWEEDFRMSYECPVPAQLRAVKYLREVAAAHPLRRIFVGGHSKGGNLALYAAVHSGDENRYRIRAVFNHDGPGFCDGTLSTPQYLELRDRIHTYIPEASIVGVLLEHEEDYKIVKSTARGIMQHDPFSWQVLGADFEYTAERTAFGRRTELILDRVINSLSPARRRILGEAVFTALGAAQRDTFSDIMANKKQSFKDIVRGFTQLDPEMQDVLTETLSALSESQRTVKKATLPLPEKSS